MLQTFTLQGFSGGNQTKTSGLVGIWQEHRPTAVLRSQISGGTQTHPLLLLNYSTRHIFDHTHKHFKKCSQDSCSSTISLFEWQQLLFWREKHDNVRWASAKITIKSTLTVRYRDQPGYHHRGNRDELGQQRERQIYQRVSVTHTAIYRVYFPTFWTYLTIILSFIQARISI